MLHVKTKKVASFSRISLIVVTRLGNFGGLTVKNRGIIEEVKGV